MRIAEQRDTNRQAQQAQQKEVNTPEPGNPERKSNRKKRKAETPSPKRTPWLLPIDKHGGQIFKKCV